ncbi:T9SS type A sorting domain-containing protein [bacterium]|nr:T9SS type A sorting domain-containing protein [bacterium]
MQSKHLCFITVLVLVLLSVQITYSQTEVERIACTLSKWDHIRDIAVQGDYAYLATGLTGLQIVDISDPAEIQFRSYVYPQNGRRTDFLAVSGDYVYLLDYGLHVIDVSDPSKPQEVNYFDREFSNAECLEVIGDRGYFGPYILDISNPVEPEIIATVDHGHTVIDNAVDGNIFFILDGGNPYDLRIYNISDPENPQLINRFRIADYAASSFEILNNYMYLSISSEGVLVLDISSLRNIFQVALIADSSFRPSDLSINNGILYAGNNREVRAVDISDPTNPEWLEFTIPTSGVMTFFNDIMLSNGSWGDSLETLEGLVIHDISDLEDIQEISHHTENSGADFLDVQDRYAYVIASRKGLYTLDISDPANPEQVSFFTEEGQCEDIEIRDDYAYLALSTHGIKILDIGDPENITELSWLEDVEASSIMLRDSIAFLASNDGIFVVDIADSEHPEYLHLFEGNYTKADIQDDIIVASYYDTLYIIDASDPGNLNLISQYITLNYINDVAISGDLCYLVTRDDGLGIIDISDPSNPQSIGFYRNAGDMRGIEIEGNNVFIADFQNGIIVLDISDPSRPHVTGYSTTPHRADKLVFSNGIVYVPEEYMLEIYDCRPVISTVADNPYSPVNPMLIGAYPNPFNAQTTIYFTLTAPGQVTLQVYDPLGRRIDRLILSQFLPSGEYKSIWNPAGLPSGNYLIQLNSCVNTTSQFITLVK